MFGGTHINEGILVSGGAPIGARPVAEGISGGAPIGEGSLVRGVVPPAAGDELVFGAALDGRSARVPRRAVSVTPAVSEQVERKVVVE